MTNEQVKSFYDERGRESHRLMKLNINEKYQNIDGDIRCAGTYINDAKGSSKNPNVIFENNMDSEELEYLIPIKALRDIDMGEELLIEYGDLFFTKETLPSIQVFIIFEFQHIEVEDEMIQSSINEPKVINQNISTIPPKLIGTPKYPNYEMISTSFDPLSTTPNWGQRSQLDISNELPKQVTLLFIN